MWRSWGCHRDECPHLLPLLLLFSWDMGVRRAQRGRYSEEVGGWRWGCFMVPPLSRIQLAEVVESELNNVRAGRLRRACKKCLIWVRGTEGEWGKDKWTLRYNKHFWNLLTFQSVGLHALNFMQKSLDFLTSFKCETWFSQLRFWLGVTQQDSCRRNLISWPYIDYTL